MLQCGVLSGALRDLTSIARRNSSDSRVSPLGCRLGQLLTQARGILATWVTVPSSLSLKYAEPSTPPAGAAVPANRILRYPRSFWSRPA